MATVAAYLLGSLSFAVIVSRLMGLSDPRSYGSKNPGATNVLRSGSKVAAIATLLLDAMKGFLPIVLVRTLGQPYGLEEGTVAWRRWRRSWATCTRCFSGLRAARAWPRRWARCLASTGRWGWPPVAPG